MDGAQKELLKRGNELDELEGKVNHEELACFDAYIEKMREYESILDSTKPPAP